MAKIKVPWKLGSKRHTTNSERDTSSFLSPSTLMPTPTPQPWYNATPFFFPNKSFSSSEDGKDIARSYLRPMGTPLQTSWHSATPQTPSLWSVFPSCPICYCLISSAKEPLPCQLSVPSVLHKMAPAQQPNTALLPGTRLPSLPQSANTGSHCWQSQDFITTTLTSAGLFVISLLSWFWLYNHLPLIQFASVLLLTDFTLHINLPLACYCICSLFYY